MNLVLRKSSEGRTLPSRPQAPSPPLGRPLNSSPAQGLLGFSLTGLGSPTQGVFPSWSSCVPFWVGPFAPPSPNIFAHHCVPTSNTVAFVDAQSLVVD